LRYLKSDPEVTRLACLDSGYIQQIAPHLIFRIPFIMPWADGGFAERVVFELAEVYFDTYDRFQPLKRGLAHCRMTAEEVYAVEPGIRPGVIGAVTMDEWGIDAQRLNIVNALDAGEHGADLHTYTRVDSLLRGDGGDVLGVRVTDRQTGEQREVFATQTINAAGPWAGRFAGSQEVSSVQVRPGKGVHVVLAGRVSNYAVVAEAIDGRQMFLCPQQNTTIIGTTDDDYFGDLEDIPVLQDEIEYLLQGAEHVFPSVRRYPIIGTTVGCRATLHEYGKTEDALGREHRVFDHSSEGADGFFSLAGGKLASYRVMSEEAVDVLQAARTAPVPGSSQECTTHTARLPGGDDHDLTVEAFTEFGLSHTAATRLLFRHGSRAEQIRVMLRDHVAYRRVVDPSDPITEAELRYVMRHEHVERLDDLKRRCRLGVGADGGARSVARAAQIFCEERDLPFDLLPEVARAFLQARSADRSAILRGPAAVSDGLMRMLVHHSQHLLSRGPSA
ncbi:MAG: glycerol-3-phosphate dehydrogenase, partial [Bradymonadia bacterium]